MKLSEWILKISGNSESKLGKLARAGDKVQQKFLSAGNRIERFSRGIRFQTIKARRSLRGLESSIGGLFSPLNGLKSLALTAFAGFGIMSAASGIIKLGTDIEQTRVAYTTFLGSVEKSNAVIDMLNGFANVTPFDNQQVLNAGKSLLAFGIQAKNLEPTLKNIGNIASGTGKDFNELATIYGKAKTQGTLFAEDINQLTEAGIPIIQQFAKQFGVAESQIKKLGSEGKINFSNLETAFQSMAGEGGQFFNLMEKQSQTFGGKWSTFVGQLQLVGIAIFDKIQPALMAFVETASAGLSWLSDNWSNIVPVLEAVGVAIGLLTAGYLYLKIPMMIATAQQWLLNSALIANPIGIVVMAIAALVGAFVYFYKTSDKLRGFIWGLWEGFKSVFTNMKNLAFSVLGGIGEMLIGVFTFDQAQIASGFQKLSTGFQEFGKNVAAGFNKGYDEGIADFNADQATEEKKPKGKSFSELFGNTTTTGGAGSSNGLNSKVDDGLKGVSGGGKSVRNVQFTVNKMFETFNVNSQNVEKGARDVGEIIKKEVLRGLRGAEQAAIN